MTRCLSYPFEERETQSIALAWEDSSIYCRCVRYYYLPEKDYQFVKSDVVSKNHERICDCGNNLNARVNLRVPRPSLKVSLD